MSATAKRRARLIHDAATRYGVTLHPHPRHDDVVVISRVEHDAYEHAVLHDPQLNAIGRGYYLYLGGELRPYVVPVWMTDPLALALLRLRVLLIDRPMRALLQRLARIPLGTTP